MRTPPPLVDVHGHLLAEIDGGPVVPVPVAVAAAGRQAWLAGVVVST